MKFSTFYFIIGISSLVFGLLMTINGFSVLNFMMPIVLIVLITGLLLWFFERLIDANQKKIPSYEEILVIYNKMIDSDKRRARRKERR
jgi:uncharacterized membrane protein